MYYKVLNSDLSSAYVGSYSITFDKREQLSVTYKIGEWTTPRIKGTDLMVFESFKDATDFMNRLCWGSKIFTCEIKNPRKKGLFVDGADVRDVLRIAALRLKHKKFLDQVDKPSLKGTVFCSAVKLLKQVA